MLLVLDSSGPENIEIEIAEIVLRILNESSEYRECILKHVVGVRQRASGPSPPPGGGQPEGIMLVRGDTSGGYQDTTI